MKGISKSIVSVLVLIAGPVSANHPDLGHVPRAQLGSSGTVLREWCQLGPFNAGDGEAALERDFLQSIPLSETGITPGTASKLCSEGGPVPTRFVAGDESGRVRFDDFYEIAVAGRGSTRETVIYLSSEIAANRETEAWLLLSRYAPYKVWLNGRTVHTCADSCRDEQSMRLPLQSGINLLLIKLGKVNGDGASMQARIEPSEAVAAREGLRRAQRVLRRPVFKPDEPLEFVLHAVPESADLVARIEAFGGTETREFAIAPGASIKHGLKTGLHRVTVTGHGGSAEQTFYIGTLIGAIAELRVRTEKAASRVEDRVAANLETLLQRLDAVSEPQESTADGDARLREYRQVRSEQRIVGAMEELVHALGEIARGAEAFRDRPGLHLRGFRSRIDDQIQHYSLFVPSEYRRDGEGLALVIIPTAPFVPEESYIERGVVSGSGAEMYTRVAEALGIGVLWPGYRVRPYGNPVDLAHLDEVLLAAAADYKVDATRLYLLATCGGAVSVNVDAVRNPQRYAAIAYRRPMLHRTKNRWDEREEFKRNSTYQRWLAEMDPMESLASRHNLPVWIIHDSSDPANGPLADSVEFVTRARVHGNAPLFERIDEHERHWQEASLAEKQMKWLARHQLKRAPPPEITTQPAAGPLLRLFGERFVVVRPTQGHATERDQAQRWYRDFCDAWQRISYVPCRTVDDVDIGAPEERESNLVLIGNVRTNAVWSRYAGKLPVQISPDSIVLKGRTWNGDALAVQTWFPHPHQRGLKMALIGSNDLARAKVGTMELALDGWFDYAIWDAGETDEVTLIEAGRYEAQSPTSQRAAP